MATNAVSRALCQSMTPVHAITVKKSRTMTVTTFAPASATISAL